MHVVSDLRTAIDGAEVAAHLSWTGDGRSWRWSGDVPADECVRVGTVGLAVPDAPGPVRLALTCRYDGTGGLQHLRIDDHSLRAGRHSGWRQPRE